MNPKAPRIHDAGDSAILLEWEDVIDSRINARAIAVAAAIRSASLPGVRDVISTYRSVAVFFDALKAEPAALRGPLTQLSDAPLEIVTGRTIEVPVAYGGQAGPDLETVADWAHLSASDVIELHTHTEYRVFMRGFT